MKENDLISIQTVKFLKWGFQQKTLAVDLSLKRFVSKEVVSYLSSLFSVKFTSFKAPPPPLIVFQDVFSALVLFFSPTLVKFFQHNSSSFSSSKTACFHTLFFLTHLYIHNSAESFNIIIINNILSNGSKEKNKETKKNPSSCTAN